MNKNIPPDTNRNYPTLLKRFQSNFIDRVITYTLMGLLFSCAMHINSESWTLKIAAIVIALSYEPLMVTFARTIGQMALGIKVRSLSLDQRTSLLNAYIRFALRLVLGWVSFLAMHTNKERRALHDIATNTVVVETA